ncbi:MAG: class I SAM-dependent methyltransferase [Anaerolineales bacterium]
MCNNPKVFQINQQFQAQSEWTALIRNYLFQEYKISSESLILEIGCGTGVILHDLTMRGYPHLLGVDINYPYLTYAKNYHHLKNLVHGDGFNLPLTSHSVDVCVFHYLLLWISPLDKLIQEALRVVKKDGYIMALAEPDYEARIDYPPALERLGKIQNEALIKAGVDLSVGRKLKGLFSSNGLREVKGGIIGQEWSEAQSLAEFDFEWKYLESDLSPYLSVDEIKKLKETDYQSRMANKRILFIPTFWAVGRVYRFFGKPT